MTPFRRNQLDQFKKTTAWIAGTIFVLMLTFSVLFTITALASGGYA